MVLSLVVAAGIVISGFAATWLGVELIFYPPQTAEARKKVRMTLAVSFIALLGFTLWATVRGERAMADLPKQVADYLKGSTEIKPVVGPPPPPTGLKAGMGWDTPLFVQEGTLRLPKSVTSCSGGKGVGYFGPRHGSSKRPQLALNPLTYRFTEWTDSVDLSFEVEITNSGEESIVKDWQLCLVLPDKSIIRFHATSLSPEADLKQTLGHGKAIAGWITFHVRRDVIELESLAQITGSLQCRDYLDKPSMIVFFAEPKKS